MKHDPKEVLSAVDPQAMSAATAYKTLLVPVDASERSARSIEVACQTGRALRCACDRLVRSTDVLHTSGVVRVRLYGVACTV